MELAVFPKSLLEAVEVIDKHWKMYGSKDGYIERQKDWDVVEHCFELFRLSYPEDFKIFVKTQRDIRGNLKEKHGGITEPDVNMQHMINIPQKMYQLINVFYPSQKWDKKFCIKLAKKLPVLSVPKIL